MSSKLALIIGNSHYQDVNLAKLVAPTEDVGDLAAVLRAPEIGGFDQVMTLIDESDAAVRLSIEDFFAEKKPDDLLVLYFSGHGVRDEQGRLYLAAPNTRANRLRATAIAADFITAEMDRSRSKRQVLILDCCHSGAFAQGSKAETGGSVGTGPAFEGTGYGRVVLTATDATQYAWEGDQIIGEADNSVFTHYLVQGLQTGEADVDADGRITLDELYDYVYGQVVARTPRQTPGKWSYKQQGDMVIARNPKPIVKPVELPADLRMAIESPLAHVRVGAVRELDRLLSGSNAGLVLAAFEAIQHLVEDDSRSVSSAASNVLNTYAEKQHAREAQERAAQERAEQERIAKAKAEAERQAVIKAERERIAAERAESERQGALKTEADRQAAIKAEQERIAAEQAERDRLAKERAAQERAEVERQAAIKAEQEQVAKAKAEAERQAALKAEQDRLVAEKARQDQAERDRIAAERAASLNEEVLDTAKRAAVSAMRVTIQHGPNAGQTFTLQRGANIIGRIGGVAIRLTDGLISRQHVRLNVESGRVTVEDLGSANGTFVNERKISDAAPITLQDGDTIAIGDTVLVFQSTVRTPTAQPHEPRVAPPEELQTMIAEAPPPKSFADQLVADQPTHLSSATELQPNGLIAARLKVIAVPALIAAAGFGLSYGIMAQLINHAFDSVIEPIRLTYSIMAQLIHTALGSVIDPILRLAAASVIPWVTINLALRKMGVVVSWQRIIAVILAWGVASGLGVGAVVVVSPTLYSSGSVDENTFALSFAIIFGGVVGFIGGQLTARILHTPVPLLRLARTAVGWTIAWVVGMMIVMLLILNMVFDTLTLILTLAGALIGAIGGGVMFWQIALGREAGVTVTASEPRAQPIGAAVSTLDSASALRAIGIICGGWIALELFVVLIGQLAPTAADTATYISLSFGVGSLVVAYVLQRAIPSMKRTAWLLAGGWSLVSIGAVQIGVGASIQSDWLAVVGVGVCGAISAWAVLREVPSVPRWQYGVIGVIWMAAYAVGSGYAWNMVVYKMYLGWCLATTMSNENLSVFSLVLGDFLSAIAGGALMYYFLNRARATVNPNRGSIK